MAALEDLLVALHGPVPRFETVRMAAESWSHRERALEAFERGSEGALIRLYATSEQEEQPPVEDTSGFRVWHRAPDRWRIERDGARGHGLSLEIYVGAEWLHYSEAEGPISNIGDSDPVSSNVDFAITTMLEPWSAASSLTFVDCEPTRFAGRDALSASARPRRRLDDPGPDWALMGLPRGAEEYRLIVDRERGVLLRIEALLDSSPFDVEEVREIVFDEPIEDEVFSFASPDSRPIRSVSERDKPEHGPLHELAARTPFTALAPRNLDAGWELRAMLFQPDAPSATGAHLHLHYHQRQGYSFGITQSASDDPQPGYDPSDSNWRTIERDGVSLDVLEQKGMFDLAIVRLERGGTHVEMQSQQLPLERLIEVALDLRPAPTEPPPTLRS